MLAKVNEMSKGMIDFERMTKQQQYLRTMHQITHDAQKKFLAVIKSKFLPFDILSTDDVDGKQ